MQKYYKPKPKYADEEVYAKKKKKLFFDKRVKSVVNCDECGAPITQAEFKRNGGVCNDCS
jgi:formylmethanofuran dehydrogenase subunit E